MTERRVACLRCGQDWLRWVTLVHLVRRAILCPECNALWQTPTGMTSANFEDYGTFMIRQGRDNPDAKDEIVLEDELLSDPVDSCL